MIRALAFTVATLAPQPTLTVILQSASGTQTCVAQGLTYQAASAGYALTVAGFVCSDSIFHNGFEGI